MKIVNVKADASLKIMVPVDLNDVVFSAQDDQHSGGTIKKLENQTLEKVWEVPIHTCRKFIHAWYQADAVGEHFLELGVETELAKLQIILRFQVRKLGVMFTQQILDLGVMSDKHVKTNLNKHSLTEISILIS